MTTTIDELKDLIAKFEKRMPYAEWTDEELCDRDNIDFLLQTYDRGVELFSKDNIKALRKLLDRPTRDAMKAFIKRCDTLYELAIKLPEEDTHEEEVPTTNDLPVNEVATLENDVTPNNVPIIFQLEIKEQAPMEDTIKITNGGELDDCDNLAEAVIDFEAFNPEAPSDLIEVLSKIEEAIEQYKEEKGVTKVQESTRRRLADYVGRRFLLAKASERRIAIAPLENKARKSDHLSHLLGLTYEHVKHEIYADIAKKALFYAPLSDPNVTAKRTLYLALEKDGFTELHLFLMYGPFSKANRIKELIKEGISTSTLTAEFLSTFAEKYWNALTSGTQIVPKADDESPQATILGWEEDQLNDLWKMTLDQVYNFIGSEYVDSVIKGQQTLESFNSTASTMYKLWKCKNMEAAAKLAIEVEHGIKVTQDNTKLLKGAKAMLDKGFTILPCKVWEEKGKKKTKLPGDYLIKSVNKLEFSSEDNAYLIPTSKQNGIMVIDLDPASKSGKKPKLAGKTLFNLILNGTGHTDLLNTFTVKTGQGLHLYFKYDTRMKYMITRMFKAEIYALDVIVDMAVFGPGSYHPIAKTYYEVVNPDAPIMTFPDDLVSLFQEHYIPTSLTGIPSIKITMDKYWNAAQVAQKAVTLLAKHAPKDFGDFHPWRTVAWCLKNAGGAFSCFHDFSKRVPNYECIEDCERVWAMHLQPKMIKKYNVKYLLGILKGSIPEDVLAKESKTGSLMLLNDIPQMHWSMDKIWKNRAVKNKLLSDPTTGPELAKRMMNYFRKQQVGCSKLVYYDAFDAVADSGSVSSFGLKVCSVRTMQELMRETYACYAKDDDSEERKVIKRPVFDINEIEPYHYLISEPDKPTWFNDPVTKMTHFNIFPKPAMTEEQLRDWAHAYPDQEKLAKRRALVRKHIMAVVNADSEEDPEFRFFIDFNGNGLFNTTSKFTCMLTVGGESGTGKSSIFKAAYRAIQGPAYNCIDGEKAGKLAENGCSTFTLGKRVVLLEEPVIKGDATESFKALITNDRVAARDLFSQATNGNPMHAIFIATVNDINKVPHDPQGRQYKSFWLNHTKIPPKGELRKAYFDELLGGDEREVGLMIATAFLDYDRNASLEHYQTKFNIELANREIKPEAEFIRDILLPNWGALMYINAEKECYIPVNTLYNEFKSWYGQTYGENGSKCSITSRDLEQYLRDKQYIFGAKPRTRMGKDNHTKQSVIDTNVVYSQCKAYHFKPRVTVASYIESTFGQADSDFDMCECGLGAVTYSLGEAKKICTRCAKSHCKDTDVKIDVLPELNDSLLTLVHYST